MDILSRDAYIYHFDVSHLINRVSNIETDFRAAKCHRQFRLYGGAQDRPCLAI